MSFGTVAVAIGFEGMAATLVGGAMLGGTMTIGANLLTGNDPFANIGKGILMGGLTAGLTPGVAEAFKGATDIALSPAMAAGLTAGGLNTLATGDLSKGLVAGLGAYGMAGLSANLGAPVTPGDPSLVPGTSGYDYFGSLNPNAPAAVDTSALTSGVSAPVTPPTGSAPANLISDFALNLPSPVSGSEIAQGYGTEGLTNYQNTPKPSFRDTMAARFAPVTENPKAFLKANASNLMYAAAPLLAGADLSEDDMPQMNTRPGMIRPYSFDPYSGQYTAGKPYQAAEGGLMGMNDGGYSPGQLNFAQRSEPVVRMASGGLASFADGGVLDAAPAYTNYSTQDITNYLQANPNADIAAAIKEKNADPVAVNKVIGQLAINKIGADFSDPTQTGRGTGTGQYADVFNKYGIDANELFAANQATNPNYTFAGDNTAGALNKAFKTAKDFKDFDPAGLSQNLKDVEWVKKMDATGANTTDIARFTGLSIGEVQARETAARALLARGMGVGSLDKVEIIPGMGGGVSGAGVTTVNPNGTVTTTPNIPDRPVGGFTGITQVKNAYTKGGGSLGYTPYYVPKTIEEFDNEYTSKLKDGSKQAYDFLTGKTAYKPTPYTATGELQKPYEEAALGYPADLPSRVAQKQYLFDAKTRTYKVNPDYVIPITDSKGVVTPGLTNKEVTDYVATQPTEAEFLTWATTNNLSDAQIAQATGMTITEVRKKLKRPKDTATTTGSSNVDPATGEPYPTSYSVAANGGLMSLARGGATEQYNLGGYSDGGRLLRGPGDGVSDSIPATIGNKRPARLADGEFVVPARIVSELGNGSTEAGARQLYAMMERVQAARKGSIGKGKVAKNSRADKYLPA